MKLHTNLSDEEIYDAFKRAAGAASVVFAEYERKGSRTHQAGIDIQLGSANKYDLPDGYTDGRGNKQTVRRTRNSGKSGASASDYPYAATWHEWGYFIAEVFKLDPSARWTGGGEYGNAQDFHAKTKGVFL